MTALAAAPLTDALLALDDLSTRLTVIALNASAFPDQSLRVRSLLKDLSDALDRCEEDLGTYGDPDASPLGPQSIWCRP